jgi:ubiquinone/menaquinone biosynthesis C-methylase UbiE
MNTVAQERQREYYAETAARYDAMHVQAGDEHYRSLTYISWLLSLLQVKSVLDVGCGTGRGVKHFLELDAGMTIRGVEPVQALIDEAVEGNGIPSDLILRGSGESLPFPDASFDVVCELGVLHHVARPDLVVSEMTRVAKKAVFLSDSNRFGHGRPSARVLKLLLYKAGLWPLANRLNTRGRGYSVSEGDGIFFSYSVFDNFDQLSSWAKRIIIVATGSESKRSWLHPLLTSHHALLCALREEP